VQPYRHLYRTQAWRRLSRAILARDGYRCATPGCRRVAETADHHPVGAWEAFATGRPELFWDTSNLVARCRSCNSALGAMARNCRYRGVPVRRRAESVECAVTEWAAGENAYWAGVEREHREAEGRRVEPRIF
jgi:hypothetical protein